MDLLTFLAPPFIAGLILTGIHAYLGLHVVERGVIFVDLSLAQIAALGATIATLVSGEMHWIETPDPDTAVRIEEMLQQRRAGSPLLAYLR